MITTYLRSQNACVTCEMRVRLRVGESVDTFSLSHTIIEIFDLQIFRV